MRASRLTATASAFVSLAAVALAYPALAQTAPTQTAPAQTAPGATPPAASTPTASTPATPPAASAAASPNPAAAAAAADPVVATVNGQAIHLSDISDAAKQLPEEYRSMPKPTLYPLLLDQLIDRKAIAIVARKDGLQNDPEVKREIERAEDAALQNALLSRDITPLVSDAAVKARYDKEYAGKPGEPEIHAAHILVPTEEEAKSVIADLDKGADFATEAKAHSKDPGAANGGDLGWFKEGDMLPEFSKAAFALKDGEITQEPVHTRYGWHVIKLEGRRTAPPPSFDQARDEIRQTMIQESLRKVLDDARGQVKVVRFNPDGSPERATDSAEPPPPAK